MDARFTKDYFQRHGNGSAYGEEYWKGSPKVYYWFMKRLKAIITSIKEAKVIIDIGCGIGYSTVLLKGLNRGLVVGIEISSDAIKEAKKRFPNVNFVIGCAQKLPLRREIADIVIAFELYEHLPEPRSFLRETYFSLRDTGFLYITTPNLRSIPRYIYGQRWLNFKDKTHVSLRTVNQIKQELKSECFQKIVFTTYLDTRFFQIPFFANLGDQIIVHAYKKNKE